MTLAEDFFRLFSGYAYAYGTYELSGKTRQDGKAEGQARTVREDVTLDLWERHLAGDQSLGIIPIDEFNNCVWGCIDVDVYDLDIVETAKTVLEHSPLVPARTKSGGLHLFLFMTEPVPAAAMRTKLGEYAAAFGFADSEIFPKQGEVRWAEGDLGSWLNMPYYNAAKPLRYFLGPNGAAVPVQRATKVATARAIAPSALPGLAAVPPAAAASPRAEEQAAAFADGPPCLQYLCSLKVPRGGRNKTLLNIGVYLKAKHPTEWQHKIAEANSKHFMEPLPHEEVQGIIRHLKKDYHYLCKDEPIKSYCNAAVCRTRKYGIPADTADIRNLRTIRVPGNPTWIVDVNNQAMTIKDVRCWTSETFFRHRCISTLNLPVEFRKGEFRAMVSKLFNDNTDILLNRHTAKILGIHGPFYNRMDRFLSYPVTTVEAMQYAKRPYLDEDRTIHFRLQDLQEFCAKDRVDIDSEITLILKEDGWSEAKLVDPKNPKRSISVWSKEVEE